ncbi:hypothetical protein BJ878DRAFT_477550 [Calycina marina]|uniref:Uncharacterized protein n=1 Tax=Calycina marina TaxID=1763456 RepID=A0A9P8CHG6_9HELO|nr:hypothetical protein BJ878DRAFT_477550 [Calycina marina]
MLVEKPGVPVHRHMRIWAPIHYGSAAFETIGSSSYEAAQLNNFTTQDNSNVSQLSTMSLDRFTLFPSLPSGLQDHMWELALPAAAFDNLPILHLRANWVVTSLSSEGNTVAAQFRLQRDTLSVEEGSQPRRTTALQTSTEVLDTTLIHVCHARTRSQSGKGATSTAKLCWNPDPTLQQVREVLLACDKCCRIGSTNEKLRPWIRERLQIQTALMEEVCAEMGVIDYMAPKVQFVFNISTPDVVCLDREDAHDQEDSQV